MTGSWYLPTLILLPVVGAVVVAAMGKAPKRTVKATALLFAMAEFVIAVFLWVAYRSDIHPYLGGPAASVPVMQEQFSFPWIPAFGIDLSLGVDGISLVMIALIALLVPIVLGASWDERLPEGRTVGGYFALILAMQGAMTGVFAATNVFVFYVFFEVMLIPMYFLIGAFGGPRRTYAATKFFLYSLLGGLLMLASLIGLYVASGRVLGSGTLDFATLRGIADQIPAGTQMWIFAGFAIAFAIKAPLVPLHTWLPDAGAEAPVGAGTLLVGILDKVGTFGFLRICLPLLPVASSRLAWLIITLSVIGILYGAIVAAGQTDMKRFVTYTSISHFGFICLGVFAFTSQAASGAVLYMVNHGIATALVFLLVGFLTTRGGSRNIADYGGVWKVAPILGGLFLIGSLATIAVPGTNSFVSEFLVLLGTFTRHPAWAIIATTGIVLAAVYMLWVFQRVMTGPVRGAAVVEVDTDPEPSVGPAETGSASGVAVLEAPHRVAASVRRRFGDLHAREIGVLTPLVVLILLLGVYPQPVLEVINPTAVQTVMSSGHTDPAPTVSEGAGK